MRNVVGAVRVRHRPAEERAQRAILFRGRGLKLATLIRGETETMMSLVITAGKEQADSPRCTDMGLNQCPTKHDLSGSVDRCKHMVFVRTS